MPASSAAEAPDLDAYFRRVGFVGEPKADLATLAQLHRLHAEAIPFENLAAFLGEPIPLDLASLQGKLVERRRGGWCFEHNLLFAAVLQAIGFEVRRLAARVRWNVPAGVITARSHMVLEVSVAREPWIADVGFGGQSLTAPLRLAGHLEQATPHESYRLVPEGEGWRLESLVEGAWGALYHFDRNEQQLVDYQVSNWYLANHPQSIFLAGIMAARAAHGMRHALRNTHYAIHHRNGRTERRVLASAAELREVLSGEMRIALPDSPRLDAALERVVREAAGS